jgi:ABC-type oligopeptide transport system ATPase subunit
VYASPAHPYTRLLLDAAPGKDSFLPENLDV